MTAVAIPLYFEEIDMGGLARKTATLADESVSDRKAVLKILDGLLVRQKLQQGGRR